MALLPRLRQLMRRPTSASRVGARRPTKAARRGDTLHEDALRSMLSDDPNNERAFGALAEIVRRRAAEASPDARPARRPDRRDRAAARRRPGRLGARRGARRQPARLVPAHRGRPPLGARRPRGHAAPARPRPPSATRPGTALVEAWPLLREAGLPVDALGLGVGHWRPREHDPEVARQLVLAAIEAGRPLEAKQHLAALDLYPDQRGGRASSRRARAARSRTPSRRSPAPDPHATTTGPGSSRARAFVVSRASGQLSPPALPDVPAVTSCSR